MTAQAVYTAAFGYETAANIPDFANRILTTSQGWWLIIVGCGVGFLFALAALCVSVISFPIMPVGPTCVRQPWHRAERADDPAAVVRT